MTRQITISTFLLLLILPWGIFMQEVLLKELLLSSPRMLFTAVEADGFLYLAGGLTNGNSVSSTIDVFEIASQTWNKTLALPSPRAVVTPVHIPPHICFVGGWSNIGAKTTFYDFDSDSRVFNSVPAPFLQNPTQMTLYESTLLALGTNSAEFLNINDTTQGWKINEDLDSVLQRVAGGIVFSHENLIFVVGGVNVSSRQPISDAWMFDIETTKLKHYEDQITPFGYLVADTINPRSRKLFSFDVANNIAATWISTRCFLFNIAADKWFNFDIVNTTNIVTVPGYTFIFTTSGFYTVNWTNSDAAPVFVGVSPGVLAHSIGYEDTAVYFVNDLDTVSSQPFVFKDGAWIPKDFRVASISNILVQVVWPNQGVVFAQSGGFFLFRNSTVTWVVQPDIRNIVVSHPQADRIHVVLQDGDSGSKLSTYNSSLVSEDIQIPLVAPTVAYNDILLDFRNSGAYSLQFPDTVIDAYNDWTEITHWVVQGPYLFVLGKRPPNTEGSSAVDIYNYETDTWTSTSDPRLPFINGYRQAFNMNGDLWVLTATGILTYNLTTTQWNLTTGSVPTPNSAMISPLVLQVNDTVYSLTVNDIILSAFNNGDKTTFLIDNARTAVHFTFSTKFNQIYISTQTSTILTWDIAQQKSNIFLLPKQDPDPEIFLASSGNFLLVSSWDNLTAIDYCDLSSKGWGTVPGLDNYIRPAAVQTITVNGTELILIAGGYDKQLDFFTDRVRLIDINSLATLPPPNTTEPVAAVVPPKDETGPAVTIPLIVGIVVPVGAALIAGALLAFFLLRRRNEKRKRGDSSSTIGLEGRYGQWYIPFSDLTFGEQLGQGGSGQVFKGTWKNTDVALKLSMTQANKSVLGELSLMMALRPHPNVVQLLGFSVHPETESVVLVLEYCNQGALDSTLFDGRHVIAVRQKVEWLVGVSKGLAHLHANNIVHRDIAARNVLLHQNDAKLTDFGMSREVAENQRGTTKSELGPIRWMAPESLKNKEYSVKSDVWSFGILAFEILAQEEPHAKEDAIQIGRFIRDESRTPQLPATCPEELTSVIKNCWQLEPAKRPNFDEITPQLESILAKL